MRYRVLVSAIVVATLALAAAAQGGSGGVVVIEPGNPVRVAVAVPLTGTLSDFGESFRNAVESALDALGDVRGYDVVQVDFDAACDPPDTSAATAIAADGGFVAVVGQPCSRGGSDWVPIYERAGIPVVSPSATHPALPSFGPTVFNRTIPPDGVWESWYRVVGAYDIDGNGVFGPCESCLPLPAVAAFRIDYETRFGESPTAFSELAYDAAHVIVNALNRVAQIRGGTLVIDRAKLARAIRDTDGLGGLSCKISFDSVGNRESKPNQLARCAS
jgi:ABC-type branched-subunit amino acid transport system substrate-binding protein